MRGSLSVNNVWIRGIANAIVLRKSGGDRRPRILPPEEVFPASQELIARFDDLKKEVDELLSRREIPKYGIFDPLRASQVSEDWRLYYVQMFGMTNELARHDLPTLYDFATSRPEVVNAMISVLDPYVPLPRHRDPYAGILRYHLGVSIPKENPPRIQLDRDWYEWKEGEGVVLDVFFEHEVINSSPEPRIIVIIDIRRPAGPITDAFNRFYLRAKRKSAPNFLDAAKYDVMH
jgi:aspartyl/asparaginyl beta-hydroxylase (cupin superfamily)